MADPFPIQTVRDLTFPDPPLLAEGTDGPDRTLVRLNLNESGLPPSSKALAAMASALTAAQSYPDHGCSRLAQLIAEATGLTSDRISFGNGSGELLTAAAALSISPGDEAVFPAPTFPTCGKGVELARGKIVSLPVTAEGINHCTAMLAAITPKTRLFYLCSPNNPTGGVVPEADLRAVARGVPDSCLLVVDEAYYEFAQAEGGPDVLSILAERSGPWAVTRSFSKAYALAGARVGYVLCSSAELAQGFQRLRGNFNVNRIGLAGAVAAFQDQSYLADLLHQTIGERQRLAKALSALGCQPFPSGANFLTVRTPCPATALARDLEAVGVLVQALPWPASEGSLRITIGCRADNDRFLSAVTPLLQAKG
ncbi:pyridoxal phosphate-dependent aminotransferase [Rhodovibrionaceae bacterium A322]